MTTKDLKKNNGNDKKVARSARHPSLRFPNFTDNWEEKKLGEVTCDMIQGVNTAIDIPEYVEKGIPMLKANDIIDGNIDLKKTDYISLKTYQSYDNRFKIKKNDFLFSNIGARLGTGTLFNTSDESSFAWNVLRIIPNELVSPSFLSLRLNSKYFYRMVLRKQSGTGMKFIPKKTLQKLKLKFPSKPEQEKIASFLGGVDDWLGNLKKQKEELEKYKKWIMQQIFPAKDSKTPKLRFPNFSGDWEEKKLGEVVKIQSGNSFKSSLFLKSGIPIIRISNISNNSNYMNMENLVYYNKIKNENNFIISKNDLLIAMSGATTGKVSIYNLKQKAYLNQRVGLFRNLDNNILNYSFLTQFVLSNLFFNQIRRVLVAGAQPNLSAKDIEEFKIKLPSLPEQEKIASFLTSIDDIILSTEQKITALEKWKKGLMQRMFV